MRKIIILVLLLLFVVILTPAYIIATPTYWQLLNYDTVTPLNESYNVSIGKNDTTTYKLYVNGSTYSYCMDANTYNNITIKCLNTNAWLSIDSGLNKNSWLAFSENGGAKFFITATNGYFSLYNNLRYLEVFNYTSVNNTMSYYSDLNVTNLNATGKITGEHWGDGKNLTYPSNESCRVRLNSNQNIPGTSWIKLIMTLEDYDLGNNYDSVTTYRYNCPSDGVYCVMYSAKINELVDRVYMESCIYVNGIRGGGYELTTASTGSTVSLANSGCDLYNLQKNDYIELYVYHSTPIGVKVAPASPETNYLCVYKVL